MTPDEFFDGHDEAKRLYVAVRAVLDDFGEAGLRVTKSQIAFRRRRAFAWVWRPEAHLHRSGLAPLVLSMSLRRRDDSPRWKEVVEPAPARFMHHLELRDPAEIDEQVRAWLREAWSAAG